MLKNLPDRCHLPTTPGPRPLVAPLKVRSSPLGGFAIIEITILLLVVGSILMAAIGFVSLMYTASCGQTAMGQAVTEISKDTTLINALQSPNLATRRIAREQVEVLATQGSRVSVCVNTTRIIKGQYSDDASATSPSYSVLAV
jgi:Tfp pilus assembly protein PilV